MSREALFTGGFVIALLIFLFLDLGLFSKAPKPVTFKRALFMSVVWMGLALSFFLLLRFRGNELHGLKGTQGIEPYNRSISIDYLTGYLLEYALSVDNIFVLILIFSSFKVEEKYFHKVLFWGILGAICMRAAFIFLGTALVTRFEWILYLFGVFLIYTGITMFLNRNKDEDLDTQAHPIVKMATRFFPVYPHFSGGRFFIVKDGKRMITPLLIVLLIIEFSDLIFAVDSIPAIFGVTRDPYIIFFSNIFAILGLRSMFFLLVGIINRFWFLTTGLSMLLVFIGAKMLLEHWVTKIGFTNLHSLMVILFILTGSVLVSVIFPKPDGMKRRPAKQKI